MPESEPHTSSTKTPEDIYDTIISPLMKQIIGECKKHNIPLVAQFDTSNPEDEKTEGDRVTTVISTGPQNNYLPDDMRRLAHLMRNGSDPQFLTIEHGDGTKTAVSIVG